MKCVALWLSLACIAMFVVQQIIGTDTVILDKNVVEEPWRYVTSLFAHANIGHLLTNLFALGLFGLILEGRIGPKRVFWLFILSGILINILTPYTRSLGASGGIFAILGTLTVLRPFMIVWVWGAPMPMILAGAVWLIQDIIGAFVPSDLGNLAHIIGLTIGMAAGFYWRKQYGDRCVRKRKEVLLERALDTWERKHRLR